MRKILQSARFKKDFKKVSQSGRYDIDDFETVVSLLAQDNPLLPKHRDHKLTGNWEGFRECHIKPDWLLIYEKPEGLLVLTRTGSHSELF